MWAAARALGGTDEPAFRGIGRASGLANLFLAVPELEARGRKPVVDGRNDAIRDLAVRALADLKAIKTPKIGRPATFAAWRAHALLQRAAQNPNLISEGSLSESEFRRRLTLIWTGLRP